MRPRSLILLAAGDGGDPAAREGGVSHVGARRFEAASHYTPTPRDPGPAPATSAKAIRSPPPDSGAFIPRVHPMRAFVRTSACSAN